MKYFILAIGLILFSFSTYKKYYEQLNSKKMNIQFAYTILYVEDVPNTIGFYKQAFGFEEKMLTPEKDYGEINTGNTTLAFANIELGESNFKEGFIESKLGNKPFGIELAFTTSDVAKTMESAIANGAVLLSEKVTKPWGQEVGYVRDLNGFIIEICSPIPNE